MHAFTTCVQHNTRTLYHRQTTNATLHTAATYEHITGRQDMMVHGTETITTDMLQTVWNELDYHVDV